MLSVGGVDGMVGDGELAGLVLEVSLDEAHSNARIIFGWALGRFHLTSTRLSDNHQHCTCDEIHSTHEQLWHLPLAKPAKVANSGILSPRKAPTIAL